MDIKELKSFCMVAKLASFSRASRAVGLGQPAVSKHVQRLEQELGRALFERGMRPLRLTAAGSNLLRMAEPLVAGLETLSSASPLLTSTPVTVAVPHGFVGYVLPGAIRDLRALMPGARARILSGTKEEVFELVQSGGVDFGVAPDPGPSRNFAFTPLFPAERMLIAPLDHPLARRAPASLKDLARYPLILPRWQTETRALLEHEFRRLNVPYDIAVELDSMEHLERYVELGVGLAVGLRGTTGSDTTDSPSRLAVVSLARFLPSETIGVVQRRSLPLSEAAVALIATLQGAAQPILSQKSRKPRKRA
ncbi:MAG: LysR family transcriptional regulator [Pseudomonadota bacterium]